MSIETQTQDLIDAANDLTAAATSLQGVIVNQVNVSRDAAQGYAIDAQISADQASTAVADAFNATFFSAHITTPLVNSTTTPADLTGHVFSIPPGKTLSITGRMIFTSAATATGAFYGYQASQPVDADGNLQGSWFAQVNLTSAPAATTLSDGDVVNLEAGEILATGVLGTASVAGNNAAIINIALKNTSTNATSTVSLQFRSESNGIAVTALLGTNATAFIG